MRRTVYLLVLMLLQFSCSIENSNNQPSILIDYMPMESVDVPSEFIYGATYTINVVYKVPSTCYSFRDIIIENQGNTKTIVILNSVIVGEICESYADRSDVASFDLTIESRDTYKLRFWRGKDENGLDDYYTVEIPVTDG